MRSAWWITGLRISRLVWLSGWWGRSGMRILRSGCGEADELEVKRSSRGGEVSAVVDAAGRVRDVSFGSACRGSDEAGLSRVVMEAIEAGRRRAAGEVESVVHRYAGEDTALGRGMLDAYRQVAGPPPPEQPQQPQEGAPGPDRAGGERRRGGPGMIVPGRG